MFQKRVLRRMSGPNTDEAAGGWKRLRNEEIHNRYASKKFFFLSSFPSFLPSSAPQPSLGLGLLHKIRLNFLKASQQFSFLQGRVFSPTPNPHPGGPGLCIYIPQRQGGYPF
jgi:hypothetical protein